MTAEVKAEVAKVAGRVAVVTVAGMVAAATVAGMGEEEMAAATVVVETGRGRWR